MILVRKKIILSASFKRLKFQIKSNLAVNNPRYFDPKSTEKKSGSPPKINLSNSFWGPQHNFIKINYSVLDPAG